MKILIHGINFSPELIGIGKYSGDMAEWLVKQGHEVRVVTALPYYPHWKIDQNYTNGWFKEEIIAPSSSDGAPKGSLVIYRCPLWVPSKLSGAKRLIHLASFAMSSSIIMFRQIFWKPDSILVIKPSLFCAPQAWLAARLSGAKAWLHIQDFEIDVAFELGMLRAEWLKRGILMAERLLLCRFDRVSTISCKMLEKLDNKGVTPDKAFLFPNWVDLAEIYPLPRLSKFRTELGILPEQTVVLYSGNIGEKVGLEIVLEAAAMLRENSEILFVLCGDGAARLRLQQEYTDLTNVMWLPLQPVEALNELLNLADIHLLPQRKDVADLVMPSKLLGMLASGRPVLTTACADSQIGGIVSQCGVLARSDATDAFLEALASLMADADQRQRLGTIGRQIAENHFSKEAVLKNFEHELKRLEGLAENTVSPVNAFEHPRR